MILRSISVVAIVHAVNMRIVSMSHRDRSNALVTLDIKAMEPFVMVLLKYFKC